MIDKIRSFASLEGLLLLNLVLGCFLANVGYLIGCSLLATACITSLAVCALLAVVSDKRTVVLWLICLISCLVATLYTFSYVDSDGITVHFPCQALLIDGWNPIKTCLPKDIMALGVDGPRWSSYVAFMPKFTALGGALIARTFSLFVGDSFVGYTLIIALGIVARRFGHHLWPSASRFAVLVFVLSCIGSTQMLSIMSGRIDYTVYAATLILSFSGWLIYERDEHRDYLVFFAAFVIAFSAKALSLAFSLLALFLLVGACAKRLRVYVMLAFCLLFAVVIGWSPIFTAWIPLEPINITEDFVANADGAKLGWIGRVLYAWFSKFIVVKIGAVLTGNSAFSPDLKCLGGGNLEGFGAVFRGLMILSVVALFLSKKNGAFWTCLMLFLLGNAMPTKYIGYSRYCPEIWAVPIIAFYNFAFCNNLQTKVTVCCLQKVVIVFFIVFSGPILLRVFAMQMRFLALESDRQKAIAELSHIDSIGEPVSGEKFVMCRRLRAGGVKVDKNNINNRISPYCGFLIIDGESAEKRDKALQIRYPEMYDLRNVIRFPWVDVLANMPHPLFVRR